MNLRSFVQKSTGWSRRRSDAFIKEYGVSVDGRRVYFPWADIDPSVQSVRIHGRRLIPGNSGELYIKFNKPKGVICSHSRQGRAGTVFSFLPREFRRLRIAGRLDKESRGLVILSTDGAFLYRMQRPEFVCRRRYEARVSGKINTGLLMKFAKCGWEHERMRFRPFFYRILQRGPSFYRIELVLIEGKKHEIRILFRRLGGAVADLLKKEHGAVKLGALKEGKWGKIEANIPLIKSQTNYKSK